MEGSLRMIIRRKFRSLRELGDGSANTETLTKANGQTENNMDTEEKSIMKARFMRVNGKMIFLTERANIQVL